MNQDAHGLMLAEPLVQNAAIIFVVYYEQDVHFYHFKRIVVVDIF